MGIKERQNSYRDIRSDLKARMLSAASKRDEHEKLAKAFDEEVLMLTKLLDHEERRFGPSQAEEAAPASLSAFITESLSRGRMDKDGLKHFAETSGLDVDGRSLHATLINMVRSGKIKEAPDGTYDLP